MYLPSPESNKGGVKEVEVKSNLLDQKTFSSFFFFVLLSLKDIMLSNTSNNMGKVTHVVLDAQSTNTGTSGTPLLSGTQRIP